jgi:excisionase family DNA binding protein
MNYPDLPRKNHLLVAEAARFLGVSEKTVRRWHRADLIKGTRLNGSLRIDRKSLLGLIDTNEREQDKDAQATLQGS